MHPSGRRRRWEVEVRNLQLRVSLSAEEVRLIQHPFKHEVTGAAVGKLNNALDEIEPLHIARDRFLQGHNLGDAAQIADKVEYYNLLFVWRKAETAP
jgi:hypothetical protein